MPTVNHSLNSFNAGEFSPLITGQNDWEKYGSGLKKALNFILRTQGPAERRGGTYFVNEIKNSGDRVWLGRFEFNTTQAFILEFGLKYIRFYTKHGLATDDNGNHLEIETPYAMEDLTSEDGTFGLGMVQSGDVIYICHEKHQTQKLSRLTNTNWTLEPVNFSGGPFENTNSDTAITVYTDQFKIWSEDGADLPDGTPTTSTLCTVQANKDIFNAAQVGSLFYIESLTGANIAAWETNKSYAKDVFCRSEGKYYQAMNAATSGTTKPTWTAGTYKDGNAGVSWRYAGSGWGVVQITEFVNAKTVKGKITIELPSQVASASGATNTWAFSDWSDDVGYPSLAEYFKGRLVFSGRHKIWFSVAGDPENFSPMADGYEVKTDDAINSFIESDPTNKVQWIISGSSLAIGTAGSELVCGPQNNSSSFGPQNIQIAKQTPYGSYSTKALRVGNDILFVQRSSSKVRLIRYDYANDSYASNDLSVYAEHITKPGIVDMKFQSEPDSVVWTVLKNGNLAALTYNAEQNVIGWSRHDIGGYVEAIEVIPDPDGGRDELWLVVRREINGQIKRYIEFLTHPWDMERQSKEQAFYVDCGASYEGVPTERLSGLNHLEGKEVAILADGAVHPNVTVNNGAIELSHAASTIHVGLPYISELITLPIEAGAAYGTAQGRTKRISKMTVRFYATVGGKVSNDRGGYDEVIKTRDFADLMDTASTAIYEDIDVDFPSGYDKHGSIRIVQDLPLPMTIIAIYPRVWTTSE